MLSSVAESTSYWFIGVVIVAAWVVIGGGIGYLIGRSRGRARLGFVLGLFLGWVGWIAIALFARTPAMGSAFDAIPEEKSSNP